MNIENMLRIFELSIRNIFSYISKFRAQKKVFLQFFCMSFSGVNVMSLIDDDSHKVSYCIRFALDNCEES